MSVGTMKNIKIAFGLLVLGLTGLWLLADTLLPEPLTYFSFRTPFIQYSGVLGMAMMSVAMILALRPRWLEPRLRGLDKMYRLHKWLGITGLIVLTLHWWWAQGSKWMVGWGWLSAPERNVSGENSLGWLEQALRNQRGWAEDVGEWAFYGAAILIILALIKAFPYHWFKKTHKWLAVAYLVLVYHSLVLMQFAYWGQPVAWVMTGLMVYGSVAAVLILAGRLGHHRKVLGKLESFKYYPDLKVTEGNIELGRGWPGHLPGPFAFVSDQSAEAAHPYTIASAWDPAAERLRFIVKNLGDWTGRLPEHLTVGMAVTVEGPYGCFDFTDDCDQQIWIGAGIGITPFIAKLEHRARSPDKLPVTLFHVTDVYDSVAIKKLVAAAKSANVQLHVRVTPKEGRLTAEQVRDAVPDWQSASLWFCGPALFADALRKDFIRHGMPPERFHQELFGMR